MSLPPLAVDIDGTLTRGDGAVDPRTFDALRAYADRAPVVVATGKAFPYPVALCEFVGLPVRVIAENGGVVCVAPPDADRPVQVRYDGDPEAAGRVAADYRERGHDLGWGPVGLPNRWRETELNVSRDRPLDPLRAVAREHDLAVVDTGYAYHVKSPDVTKATGLTTAAAELGRDPGAFAAIGDSENDAALFEVAGRALAVANADATARRTADAVTDTGYADGFLEALERVAGEPLP